MCESVRYRGVPAHRGTDAGLPAGIGVRPSCFALRGPEQVKKPLRLCASFARPSHGGSDGVPRGSDGVPGFVRV